MKKRMFLFLMLIAVCLCLNAQSRIEISGSDTSAIISIKQLRIANAKFVELKECKEEKDFLASQISTYSILVDNLRSSINSLKETNKIDEMLLIDNQKIINLSEKQLKKTTRKVKFLQIQRSTLAGTLLIMAAKIFLFH